MTQESEYEKPCELIYADPGPVPAYKLALAGSVAGGIAGVVGNPAELMMVRMQADRAKPPESEYSPRELVVR